MGELLIDQLTTIERFWTMTAVMDASKSESNTPWYDRYVAVTQKMPYKEKIGNKVLPKEQAPMIIMGYMGKMGRSVPRTLKQSKMSVLRILVHLFNSSDLASSRAVVERDLDCKYTVKDETLVEPDIKERYNFATKMNAELESKRIQLDNIAWTDECWLRETKDAKTHEEKFWRVRGTQCEPITKSTDDGHTSSKKIFMFSLMHPKVGTIGPHFIPDIVREDGSRTLDYTKYKAAVTTSIESLKEKLGANFDTCWFQQEGAPNESPRSDIEILNTFFDGRVISKHAAFSWPSNASELSPFDYRFWPAVQMIVSDEPTLDEIETRIRIVAKYYIMERIARGVRDFPVKLKAVIKNKGGHFDDDFQQAKKLIMKRCKNMKVEPKRDSDLIKCCSRNEELTHQTFTPFEFSQVLPYMMDQEDF